MTPLRGEFPPVSSASAERLILFTRHPSPGRTKTRLIPVLGPDGAAQLQRRLTLRALRAAEALRDRRAVELEVQFEGATESTMQHWLGDRFCFCPQAQGDLGKRMSEAFNNSFRQGAPATVLIGADCPELTTPILEEAFLRLRQSPVVLGPATDGGYYLIGLRRPVPQLFCGPAWGTGSVLEESLRILKRLGLEVSMLRALSDIDRPEDLKLWHRVDRSEAADLGSVTVIIPTLNEEEQIGAAIEAAGGATPGEIIVVDGGSRDQTLARAEAAGASILCSQPGRARQMNAGASKASGQILLFLHADTLLPPGYRSLVAQVLSDRSVSAGAFRFAIRDSFPGRKLVELTTNLRSRWRQLPYGDQALFLLRSLFEELGGFGDQPMLEDYELVRRLRRRGRIVTLSEAAVTSGRRWLELGFLRTTLINKWMILGYHLGWPMDQLVATYRKPRIPQIKSSRARGGIPGPARR